MGGLRRISGAAGAAATCLAAAAALAAVLLAASPWVGYSRSAGAGVAAHYRAKFGPAVDARIEGWKRFVRETDRRAPAVGIALRDGEVLLAVNGFFNRIPAALDADTWGTVEYWATPAETVSVNAADCEDYAIAKYYALKELGVPVSRLRLVYATTTLTREAHMVLAYYAAPGAEPLILDNLVPRIARASERPDLTPVFSFNDEDLSMSNSPGVRVSPASNRRWAELLQKLEREMNL